MFHKVVKWLSFHYFYELIGGAPDIVLQNEINKNRYIIFYNLVLYITKNSNTVDTVLEEI